MNFSPSSISHRPRSRGGLRTRPAAEILHHLLLADLKGSGLSRDSEPLCIEIRAAETEQQAEILALPDLPQVRTLTVHSLPVPLRPI